MRPFIFIFLLISLSSYSQENAKAVKIQKNNVRVASASHPEYPRFIPPSPEVSSIFKFVDYPVSHSTGLTQTSIPLYTITCGNLTLPISIDYHAAGRMYADMTGSIGMGWILNAGGTMSRTVYGFPDEDKPVPSTLKESRNLSITTDYRYLAGLYYGNNEPFSENVDGEYDIYSYSLPGLSGSFVYHNNNPMSLTLNAVKIEKQSGSGHYNYGFIITAEDGKKYVFGDPEKTTMSSPYVSASSTANTSWYLKEIRSADEKHVIRLTYTYVDIVPGGNSSIKHTTVNESLVVNDMAAGSYKYNIGMPIEYKTSSMQLTFRSKRLKEIDFATGKVEFDFENIGGKVKKVNIKDVTGSVIKTFEFAHSLLDRTATENYKLDQLSCTSGMNKSDVYRFEYYPTSVSFGSSKCDYWGYINNNYSTFFIPSFEININQKKTSVGNSNADREPDDNKKSGVLKKVIYPTGSNTEYIYENNKYYSGNTVKNGPGLRIKQIKTTDDSGIIQLRTFEYGGEGVGYLVMTPEIRYWGFESIYLDVTGSMTNPDSNYAGHYRQRMYSSEAPQDAAYYAGQSIFYSTVTEYKGDLNSNTGKTIYRYMNPNSDSQVYNIPSAIYPSSYPSFYPTGMPKSFNFDNFSYYYRYTYQFGSLWKDRNLESQIEYTNKNGSYNIIKSINYYYENLTAPTLNGLKIFKHIQVKDDYAHYTEEFIATEFGLPVFLFASYYITRGRQLLTSVIEKEVRQDSIVSTTRTLTYGSNYLLKSSSLQNSSGVSQIEKILYPSDDEYKNLDVYRKMIQLNMLNIPLRKSIVQNNKSYSVSTNFAEFGPSYIKPSQLVTQKDSDTPAVRMVYHRYDNYGNPIYVTTDNIMNTVYLWGYNGLYPVAKIENATDKEVEAALGASLESVSSSSTYDSRIEQLPTNALLANAHITLYKYKPLVGIKSVTAPTGLIMNYTYDLFNRLQQISTKEPGGNDKVIETYNYHYRP